MKNLFKGVLIGVLFASYFLAVLLESDLFGNILSPIVTFIAAYYIFKGHCLKEENKTIKIAGFFMSLGVLNWAICDFMWGIADIVYKINPNEVNIIAYSYSFTNLFLLISLLIAGSHELRRWSGVQVLLDTVAISICTMILVWVIFLNQDMKNIVTMKNDWVAMASVVINFLILVWTGIWLFSIRKGKVPLYLKFMGLGVIVFLVADIIYYYQYFYTMYEPNSLLDGTYVFSFGIIAIGFIVKLKEQNTVNINVSENSSDRERGFILVAAPLILILFRGLQWEHILVMILVIMIYFIFTSYVQKNIYRDEILEKEKRLNLELEKKVAERTEKLKQLVNRDVITGLYSRRYFLEQLNRQIHELDKSENIILFYIDLNRYKMIKTMFGNYIGEKTLIEMGRRLNRYEHKKDDILASYGEDVFVFSMKGNYTYEKGEEIAQRLIDLSSDVYKIEGYDIRVTVNIGISIYPIDSKNREDFIKHADIAMMQARTAGFNKVMTFNSQLGELVSCKNKIEIMLKKVHFDKEFLLHYQPQISLKDGKVIGFEALLRWKTKDGSYIPPGRFIPIAEETGFIIPIGYWVIKKALKQLAEWNKISSIKPRIAINVSAKQLSERKFIARLKEIIEKNNISPEKVEIEIVESIELDETMEIKEMIQEISDMGITIAVDDFGTGYSSLYYLKNLPINRVKIAKPLIDRIEQDIYDYTIVKSVISIAKVKGIRVIAEGVETNAQLECLKELECDEIQGYYFAKPMSPEEISDKWLD